MIRTLRRNVARKLRQDGILNTLKCGSAKIIRELHKLHPSNRETPDPFDSRYGTDTARTVSVGALDISEEQLSHANRYQTISQEEFCAIIGDAPIAPQKFVFVDIGSGKGRVLLLASRFPFKRIVGVEISASLNRIAANNIAIYRDESQRCHAIETRCGDAASFELPHDEMVIFLYNPFDADIMRRLAANVERSLCSLPRDVYVLYQQPIHREIWDHSKLFRCVKETPAYTIHRSNLLQGAQ